jgi:hypothetical protein
VTAFITNYGIDLVSADAAAPAAPVGLKWGKSKKLSDGRIFGAPYLARDYFVVTPGSPATATRVPWGINQSKFSGMASYYESCDQHPNGNLYLAPHYPVEIAVVDPVGGTTTYTNFGTAMTEFVHKFGATLAMPNGEVWFLPEDLGDCGYLNVGTGVLTRNGFALGLTSANNSLKWRDAVAVGDIIYCIPHRNAFVLRIDTLAKTAALNNYGLTLTDDFKWWGGVYHPGTNKIFCAPSDATDCLIIDHGAGTATRNNFGIDFTLYGSGNRFRKGCVGPDGKLYFSPYDSTPAANPQGINVLQIDPVAMTAQILSFNLLNVQTVSRYLDLTLGDDNVMYGCPFTGRLNMELSVSGVTTPGWVLPNFAYDLDFQKGRYFGDTLANLISWTRAGSKTNLMSWCQAGFAYSTFGTDVKVITPGLGALIEPPQEPICSWSPRFLPHRPSHFPRRAAIRFGATALVLPLLRLAPRR